MLYMCPESPAWYIKNGDRYDLAFRSLRTLRNTELQAAKEIYSTYIQRRTKSKVADAKEASYSHRIFELFSVPRIRRATTASYVVMLSQQLCGSKRFVNHFFMDWPNTRILVNIIAFYSSTVSLQTCYWVRSP